jgi:Flp pilus assembly protein TadG
MIRSERGTSMLEFALLAPMLVFMLIGLIEIGRFGYFWIVADHAARAGVQYGAQNLETAADAAGNVGATDSAALADAKVSGWTAKSSIACAINGSFVQCPNDTSVASPGLVYYVQVQVTGSVNSLLNYPGIPHTMQISATHIQRVVDQ